jgi:hypothetical protein
MNEEEGAMRDVLSGKKKHQIDGVSKKMKKTMLAS